jgi:hypothetical protein
MEYDLTLKEKYLLLCYHPEKGRMLGTASYASYGLVGAIMLELAGMDKYKIENKKLVLTDQKETGDKALDMVLERIAKSQRPKKLNTWIANISQSGMAGKIKTLVRESLMDKRILSKREKTTLIIFKYNRYPARNTRPRRQIISEMQNVVVRRRIGTNDIMLLIALIGATKMINSFFLPEDRKLARKRIKEIIKNNDLAKMLDCTITAVQAAVVVAISTTAAASAAVSSSH